MVNELGFVSQPDEGLCCPTAILNAAVWAGHQLTLDKDFERIRASLAWEGRGSRDLGHLCLRKEVAPLARVVQNILGPSAYQLAWFLEDPAHAVLLSYLTEYELEKSLKLPPSLDPPLYHDILLTSYDRSQTTFCAINERKGSVMTHVRLDNMAYWLSSLRRLHGKCHPGHALFLSKDPLEPARGVVLDDPGGNRQLVVHHKVLPDVKPIDQGSFIIFAGPEAAVSGSSIIGLKYDDLCLSTRYPAMYGWTPFFQGSK